MFLAKEYSYENTILRGEKPHHDENLNEDVEEDDLIPDFDAIEAESGCKLNLY